MTCLPMSSILSLIVVLTLAGCGTESADTGGPDVPTTAAVPAQTAAFEAPEPDSLTRRLFDETMAFARERALHEEPLGQIMQTLGERFVGTPYKAGLLDAPDEETLLTRLDAFDCVLFFETMLAMAQGIAERDYAFETFARNLQDLRYRGGVLQGYCSRLHYFSDWVANNEERGHVENVTEALGGVPFEKELSFMGANRDKYRRLAQNDSLYQGIVAMEERLRDLELYYIPQDRIREAYDQIQAGDIVATATDLEGLDVTHSGLAYKHDDGSVGFLHASTSGGVKVSPDLQSYVQNNDVQVGIVVARPARRGSAGGTP